jgi:hypothetical protein
MNFNTTNNKAFLWKLMYDNGLFKNLDDKYAKEVHNYFDLKIFNAAKTDITKEDLNAADFMTKADKAEQKRFLKKQLKDDSDAQKAFERDEMKLQKAFERDEMKLRKKQSKDDSDAKRAFEKDEMKLRKKQLQDDKKQQAKILSNFDYTTSKADKKAIIEKNKALNLLQKMEKQQQMKHTRIQMQSFQDDCGAMKRREEDQRNRQNLRNWKANSLPYQINKQRWYQERKLFINVGRDLASKANQADKARHTSNLRMNRSLLKVDNLRRKRAMSEKQNKEAAKKFDAASMAEVRTALLDTIREDMERHHGAQQSVRPSDLYRPYNLDWAQTMEHFVHPCLLNHYPHAIGLSRMLYALNLGQNQFDMTAPLPSAADYPAMDQPRWNPYVPSSMRNPYPVRCVTQDPPQSTHAEFELARNQVLDTQSDLDPMDMDGEHGGLDCSHPVLQAYLDRNAVSAENRDAAIHFS